MSTTVEWKRIPSGDDAFVEEAWALKEKIRRQEGVLKQQRHFFVNAYKHSTVTLTIDRSNEDVIGFAASRNGGYLLFLAVDPAYQGSGYGRDLIAKALEEHGTVTCHARKSNEAALGFYQSLGFTIIRSISGYYEDGGDAYYLKLGEDASMREKIARILGG